MISLEPLGLSAAGMDLGSADSGLSWPDGTADLNSYLARCEEGMFFEPSMQVIHEIGACLGPDQLPNESKLACQPGIFFNDARTPAALVPCLKTPEAADQFSHFRMNEYGFPESFFYHPNGTPIIASFTPFPQTPMLLPLQHSFLRPNPTPMVNNNVSQFHHVQSISDPTAERPTLDGRRRRSFPIADSESTFPRLSSKISGSAVMAEKSKLPFLCSIEGCGRLFKRYEHLKRHNLMHTGERPFECDICLKRFSRSDNFNQHKKTHSKREEEPSSEEEYKSPASSLGLVGPLSCRGDSTPSLDLERRAPAFLNEPTLGPDGHVLPINYVTFTM